MPGVYILKLKIVTYFNHLSIIQVKNYVIKLSTVPLLLCMHFTNYSCFKPYGISPSGFELFPDSISVLECSPFLGVSNCILFILPLIGET